MWGVGKGFEVDEVKGVISNKPRTALALRDAASGANPQADKIAGFGPRKNNPLTLFHHGGEFFGQEILEFVGALVRASKKGLVQALVGPVGRSKPNRSTVGAKHLQKGGSRMVEVQTRGKITATTTSKNKTLPTEFSQQISVAMDVLTEFGTLEGVNSADRGCGRPEARG
jgi:hypothetical protein